MRRKARSARHTVFEDVSDAISRVSSTVRARNDSDAMEEVEGMCCTEAKQFWCRYMPGLENLLSTASAAPSRPVSGSVSGAGARVGGVGRVSGVSSAVLVSADNSILERKESGAGLRFSSAAERKRKSASLHKAIKAKSKGKAQRKNGAAGFEKDQATERAEAERRTLQQRLTAVMEGLQLDGLLEAAEPAEGARLRHCALPHAWLWLLVCPLERCLVLSDQDMCAALRHQYGLPPKAGAPWYCRCGQALTPGHLHTCNRVSGPSTFARHELIVSELCAAAQTHMQLHVTRQPVMPFTERVERNEAVAAGRMRLVPDILFDGADMCLATDVSVLFGEADSKLNVKDPVSAACKRLHAQCKRRETEKTRKYQHECKQQLRAEFRPFVVESHGFIGAGAQILLNQLACYGSEVLGCTTTEMSGYLRRRIAIAIQRGNAALDRTGIQLSRNSYGASVARGMVVAGHSSAVQDSAPRRRSRSHSASRRRSHAAAARS